MSNMTIVEVRERLFNKDILRLLVADYEESKAYQGSEGEEYFKQEIWQKAEEISKHILSHSTVAAFNAVKDILLEDKE